jgi:hypothetical protein
MHTPDQLARMNADELRQFAAQLISEIADTRRELTDTRQDNTLQQLKIDQFTHVMAILKRWKFTARSEQLHGEQCHLFDETVEADLEAIGLELLALQRAQNRLPAKVVPKRPALPAHLPRT